MMGPLRRRSRSINLQMAFEGLDLMDACGMDAKGNQSGKQYRYLLSPLHLPRVSA